MHRSVAPLLISSLIGFTGAIGACPPAAAEARPSQNATTNAPTGATYLGVWALTDSNNNLFNVRVSAGGRAVSTIGTAGVPMAGAGRLSNAQFRELGRWQPWGNGIRADYGSGWTDTIQIGPAGAEQWSWAPAANLNKPPTNHGKAVKLEGSAMRWVGAYSLQPTQTNKPPYTAVLTSAGLAFNDIDHIADGSWTIRSDGSVMIKWTSGWRTAILTTAPTAGGSFAVDHWRPGVPTTAPASARRQGQRL